MAFGRPALKHATGERFALRLFVVVEPAERPELFVTVRVRIDPVVDFVRRCAAESAAEDRMLTAVRVACQHALPDAFPFARQALASITCRPAAHHARSPIPLVRLSHRVHRTGRTPTLTHARAFLERIVGPSALVETHVAQRRERSLRSDELHSRALERFRAHHWIEMRQA
jgi:hypothetical protein